MGRSPNGVWCKGPNGELKLQHVFNGFFNARDFDFASGFKNGVFSLGCGVDDAEVSFEFGFGAGRTDDDAVVGRRI